MYWRRELNSDDVRELVFKSIDLIEEVQKELELPICHEIEETKKRLVNGVFKAEPFPLQRIGAYRMAHGSFEPPASITLDSLLPFCDKPMNVPEVIQTLCHYTAVHEVIHADDFTNYDRLFVQTLNHILNEHSDKLKKGMNIIKGRWKCKQIETYEDLACLWTIHYVNMTAHYRSYVVLRHKKFPRLNFLWSHIQDDFFPPNLLTNIEREKDMKYVFKVILDKPGEYCLIDALMESSSIGEKNASKYTV